MSYLIKIGGSLIPFRVPAIYKALKKSIRSNRVKTFIFPGGGEFADLIRKYRSSLSLGDRTTHKMALACLDQNAYLIADLCQCPCADSLKKIKTAKTYPLVIAPSRILSTPGLFSGYDLNIDTFSSDSSAIYLAHLLKARMIIATDVDGVYPADPRGDKKRTGLLKEISTRELSRIKRGGPLDGTVWKLINKYDIEVWVVNGVYPQRLVDIINKQDTERATLVRPIN